MYCPNCGKKNFAGDIYCRSCGNEMKSGSVPFSPPAPYLVSSKKIALLSISTIGLYYVYWFYRQFNSFKHDRKWQISPLLRALFWVVTSYSLLKKVAEAVKEVDKNRRFNAGGIAGSIIGIFVINAIVMSVVQTFSLIIILTNPLLFALPVLFGFLYIIPLTIAQHQINYYWKKKLGAQARESKFTLRDYVAVSLAGLVIVYFLTTMLSVYSAMKKLTGSNNDTGPSFQDPLKLPNNEPTIVLINKPVLGVEYRMTYDMFWQDNNHPLGAYITDVKSGSIAQKSGILPGDIIMEIDGQVLDALHELKPVMGTKKIGDTILVKVSRKNSILNLNIVLN